MSLWDGFCNVIIILQKHSKSENEYSQLGGRWNSSVGNPSDLVTHRWAAHHCVGGSNPDACERSLASHAVYMLIQCTPLLVEKAGVAPEMNLRNLLCTGEEAGKRGNPPWLWNPGQTSPEVQNRGISGPAKRTCVLQKNFKKKYSQWDSVCVWVLSFCFSVGI